MESSFRSFIPCRLWDEIELGRAAVAGGAVRAHFESRVPRDIDVLVFDWHLHRELCAELGGVEKTDTGGAHVSISAGQVDVELVCLPFWSSVSDYQAHVDLSASAGVYCAGHWHLPEVFLTDIRERRLRYLGWTMDYPATYGRIVRYNREYGYRMDESVHAFMRQWREQKGD